MKAFAVLFVVVTICSSAWAQADNCTVQSTRITVPNLLTLQQCMKGDNSALAAALKDFMNSSLYQKDAFGGAENLTNYFPKQDGVVDLTGLSSCEYNNETDTRVPRALLVLTKLVLCIHVSDLATPAGMMVLGGQLAVTTFALGKNLVGSSVPSVPGTGGTKSNPVPITDAIKKIIPIPFSG